MGPLGSNLKQLGGYCVKLLKTALPAIVFTVSCMVATNVVGATIKFWTSEVQPARMEVQKKVAANFEKKTGHKVEFIPVEENELGARATAAYAAGALPDIIIVPLNDVLPWVEAGVLDVDANDKIVNDLGVDTFPSGVLSMVTTEDGIAAVPFSAWQYITLFRKSRFKELGLAQPTSFDAVLDAARKLHNPPNVYGFAIATKVDEGFMSQTLEQLFLANGVFPFKKDGTVDFDRKKTIEVLNFYKDLKDLSPAGELYWKQTRETYFNGSVELTFWSPFILDEMAGLRDSAPPSIDGNPTSSALAKDTEVLTGLAGPSNPEGATWVDTTYLGVTSDANTKVASEFVKFAMSEGYLDLLGMAPEGLFPVRNGPVSGSMAYVDGWGTLPVGVDRKAPLSDFYSKETINGLVAGLKIGKRWGVAQGQLAKASKVINSQIVNRIVREFADGVRDADATVDMLNSEVAKIK